MDQSRTRARQGSPKDQPGFTRIGFLVVIIILGVLSAVVVFAVRGSGDKDESAAKTPDEQAIRTAQEAFCAQKGHYAATEQELLDARLLSEESESNVIVPATGDCGSGAPGQPSGYRVATAAVPQEITLTAGSAGYASPFSYDRGGSFIMMHYLYDSLLWKDATGALIPWLARELPQHTADNPATPQSEESYTFVLRQGVKWHDGRAFTADDVKFTYDYYKEKAAAGQIPATVIAPPIPEIASVEVLGGDRVRFNLSAPAATFLQFGAAGAVPIAPKHIWESIANPQSVSGDHSKLVGTGPYRLAPRPNDNPNFLFTANDDYFLGAPKVKTLKYIERGDNSQGANLLALENGEVHLANASGRPSVIDPFRTRPEFAVLAAPPGSSTTQLNFNHAQAPFNDRSFRRAVAQAVDRQKIADTLFGEAGKQANALPGNPGWIPPAHPVYEPAAQQWPRNINAANELLDGTYPKGANGVRMEMELSIGGQNQTAMANLVKADLAEIGIVVNPVVRDDLNARIRNGTVGMYFIGSGGLNSDLGADYPRLVYRTGATLVQRALNYSNPALDAKLVAQHRETDEAARKAILSDIQKQIADEVPLLPLVYPDSFSIWRRSVFDQWYYTPGGVGGVVPTITNKHLFVAGNPTGL